MTQTCSSINMTIFGRAVQWFTHALYWHGVRWRLQYIPIWSTRRRPSRLVRGLRWSRPFDHFCFTCHRNRLYVIQAEGSNSRLKTDEIGSNIIHVRFFALMKTPILIGLVRQNQRRINVWIGDRYLSSASITLSPRSCARLDVVGLLFYISNKKEHDGDKKPSLFVATKMYGEALEPVYHFGRHSTVVQLSFKNTIDW